MSPIRLKMEKVLLTHPPHMLDLIEIGLGVDCLRESFLWPLAAPARHY